MGDRCVFFAYNRYINRLDAWMKRTFEVSLKMPPSVNNLYKWSYKTRKMYITDAGKSYKTQSYWDIYQKMHKTHFSPFNDCVEISIKMLLKDRTTHDCDNILKVLLDTLVKSQLIKDDDLVLKLSIQKIYTQSETGVLVTVTDYVDYQPLTGDGGEENRFRFEQVRYRLDCREDIRCPALVIMPHKVTSYTLPTADDIKNSGV